MCVWVCVLCCVDGYTFASSNQCDSICILYIELKCVVKSNFNWTYDTTHKSTGHSNENAGMKCFICGGTFDSGFRIIYLLSFRSILFDCSNLISYIYLLTIVMLNATHVNMCIVVVVVGFILLHSLQLINFIRWVDSRCPFEYRH